VRNERRQSVETRRTAWWKRDCFMNFSRRASLLRRSDRFAPGHSVREAGRRAEFLSSCTTRRTTRAWPLWGTSIPRKRASCAKIFRPAEARGGCSEDQGAHAADYVRAESVIQDNVQLPRVYLAWLTSPIFKPGDAEADLAAAILGGGKSSRLYKKLVYERQIAQDVSVNQQSLILGSVFEVQVTAKAGVKPEDLEKRSTRRSMRSAKTGRRGGAHASAQRDRIENHRGARDAWRFRRRCGPIE